MLHSVRLFASTALALRPFLELGSSARLYTLTPTDDLVVLPFDDALQDAVHDRLGTGDWPDGQGLLLSTTDQAFAAECSTRAPVAYLETDRTDDGTNLQSAAVWQHGQATIGPSTLDLNGPAARRARTLWPINVALHALGILAIDERDAATVFGLHDFASNVDIHARAWPVRW